MIPAASFWVGAVTSEYRSGGAAPYRAAFADVSGLRQGDQVRAAGVRVGEVTDIDEVELETLSGSPAAVGSAGRREQRA